MRSPGQRLRLKISSSLIHFRLPSGEAMRWPVKLEAVKTKAIQSSMPSNMGKVRMPLSWGFWMVRPDSSLTSRMMHSSGVSPGSNLPPKPFHLPSCMSFSFLMRCNMRVWPLCLI